ncbi:hypothetical protein QTP88_001207 [Uroleucon formosanum]
MLARRHRSMNRHNSKTRVKRSYHPPTTASGRRTSRRLVTAATGFSEYQLEFGEYVYPFNFSLPHEIPSKFKIKMNIPWRKNIEKEIMFEVISPIHLNDEPSLAELKTALKEKFYCCWLYKSGSMKLIAYIPYNGFIPGQSIPVTVEFYNKSNVNTLEYKARFPDGNLNYKHSNIVNVNIGFPRFLC